MQGEAWHENAAVQQPFQSVMSPIQQTPPPVQSEEVQAGLPCAFGLFAMMPPTLDQQFTTPRADEVSAVLATLIQRQTSAVMLLGRAGAGKTTLAALLYQRLVAAQQTGAAAPRHLVWLTLDSETTLLDMLAAILSGIGADEPAFFSLLPEQQISTLLRALRRTQQSALIVLDRFEMLLQPGVEGRAMLPLFLDMLQTDLGASRILLTSTLFPYQQKSASLHIQTYQVPHISTSEGVQLLRLRYMSEVQAIATTPEMLMLAWQRCGGHALSLTLFSALSLLSNVPPNELLASPIWQHVWQGDVAQNLLTEVYRRLTPVQYAMMRVLSLMHEPMSLVSLMLTVTEVETDVARPGPKRATLASTSPTSLQHRARSQATFEQEIRALARLALVQTYTPETGGSYYALHPLLRQHVLEHFLEGGNQQRTTGEQWALLSGGGNGIPGSAQARGEEQRTAVAAAHMQIAGYYQQIPYPKRGHRTSVRDVLPLLARIRHLCLGGQGQRACTLLFAENLHESMIKWGALHTLINLYLGLLAPPGILMSADGGLVSSYLGMLYGRIGQHEQSQYYYKQALAIQRELGDLHAQAITLTNQGEIWRLRGDVEGAKASFERALALEQQQPNTQLRCVLLHDIGLLYHNTKQYEAAYDYYLSALRLSYGLRQDARASRTGIATANVGTILTNLGMLLYEQRQPQESIALLLAAIQLRRAQQDPTVNMLERFFAAIEQKMGNAAYTELCHSALAIQHQLLAKLLTSA
jgi:Tfp pilus assembly protein PilF